MGVFTRPRTSCSIRQGEKVVWSGIYCEKTQGFLCGMTSQRDAHGQHELAVKHTCSAGEINRLKTERSEGVWGTHKYLRFSLLRDSYFLG